MTVNSCPFSGDNFGATYHIAGSTGSYQDVRCDQAREVGGEEEESICLCKSGVCLASGEDINS